MRFAKPKPGRNVLQRLSDQRRSLALAGLAAGALGAAIFSRRRRGKPEVERPMPSTPTPTTTTTTSPESGPPAAVAVPPPAAPEPEAAPGSARDAAPESEATVQTLVEPATGELSAGEASILAVLAQHGRADEDRTAIAVATSLERETTDIAAVLRKLSAEGVVAGALYTAAGDKIWTVTERGVRRLGAQS